MASEVTLPELGENVAAGDVVDIKVKVGDTVKAGQPLVEIEAEKSTVEVPSPFAGRIEKILIKKGDKVKAGQAIVSIQEMDGKLAAAPEKETPRAAPKTGTPEKAEAEPAAITATAPKQAEPTDGAAKKPEAPPKPKEPAATPSAKPQAAAEDGAVVPAGPATRKLAREWGIDVARVPPTGPRGRVTPDDVKAFVKSLATGEVATRMPAAPLPNFEQWGPVEYKPFDSIRRKTADHVTLAWTTVPHVTQHDQADITDIEAFRKQHKDDKGPKLTVSAFVLKACAIMLRDMPQFNASLDLAKGQLVFKKYIHLGVAVDTERGLLVPVVRDADRKSVQDIAREMAELADRARQKKLSADDMRGGSFTISNLGGIGGTGFSPIVNYPEVAILGLSRSRTQPVFRDGQFVPRLLMPLSLSYDHRVIDGADAARFARRLAELLEQPLLMLLHA